MISETISKSGTLLDAITSDISPECAATMAKQKRNTKALCARSKQPEPRANRPQKLRTWTDEMMVGAMREVTSGAMGVNRAAAQYGVPRTTLKDRIAGRVVHGTNMGTKPYLSADEEKELVDFLMKCSEAGYGKTRGDMLQCVGTVIQKKGDCVTVSDGWWSRFLKRWPQLRLRKGTVAERDPLA